MEQSTSFFFVTCLRSQPQYIFSRNREPTILIDGIIFNVICKIGAGAS